MSQLHFGVDVDGVLAHHLPSMLAIVEDVTGLALRPDQIEDYYFAGLVSRERMEEVFKKCMDCAMELPPMPGHRLINELPGKVSIVTHRHEEMAGVTTRAWLAHHGIQYDQLIFTKGLKSQTGHFDYFIDDAPHNALDLAESGAIIFLMEQPYNRTSTFGSYEDRVIRISSWHDVQDYLMKRSLWTSSRGPAA